MENLKQVVYVVVDNEEQKILGVFNDYVNAKKVAYDMNKLEYDGSEISITPVLVDAINPNDESRQMWTTEQEVINATQEEVNLAMPVNEDDDNDYEEDDDYDEDNDWDEDEDEDTLPPDIDLFELIMRIYGQ